MIVYATEKLFIKPKLFYLPFNYVIQTNRPLETQILYEVIC